MRVAELAELIPRTPDLAPLLDLVVSSSTPDPERRWTGSGELGSVGNRLVDAAAVSLRSGEVAEGEARRLASLYHRAARFVEAMAAGRWADAVDVSIEQGLSDEELGRDGEAEAWFLAANRTARDRGGSRALEAARLAARTARHLGRLDDAARRYEETWRSAKEMHLETDMIVSAIGRGNVAVDQGRWEEAREWYERVLAQLREAGEPRRERWQTLQNLAIVHRRSGDLKEARRFLDLARNEGARLDDPDAAVEVGNGWGQLLMAEGDLRLLAQVAKARGEAEAFVLLEQALALIRERGLPPYEEALTREAYGDLRLDEGDIARGFAQLEAAAGIYAALGMSGASGRLLQRTAHAEPRLGESRATRGPSEEGP
jgi:tetratricopeptide (TPR) repeat protein